MSPIDFIKEHTFPIAIAAFAILAVLTFPYPADEGERAQRIESAREWARIHGYSPKFVSCYHKSSYSKCTAGRQVKGRPPAGLHCDEDVCILATAD